MSDILIRGLRADVVTRIDQEASRQGLSRNQYLVKQIESRYIDDEAVAVTVSDLERASRATADLLDPEVMAEAWR